MAKKSGNKLGYAFQALVTVIVALATLEATFLIQYYFSRKTIYEEATRRAACGPCPGVSWNATRLLAEPPLR